MGYASARHVRKFSQGSQAVAGGRKRSQAVGSPIDRILAQCVLAQCATCSPTRFSFFLTSSTSSVLGNMCVSPGTKRGYTWFRDL